MKLESKLKQMLKSKPPDMRFPPANESDYLYEPLNLLCWHDPPVPKSFSSVHVKRNASQIDDEFYPVLPEKRHQLKIEPHFEDISDSFKTAC